MNLEALRQEFAICKITDPAQIDFSDPCCFVGKTEEELSLVCGADRVPQGALSCETGWRAFRVRGALDFSLTGILSELSGVLAARQIGIFAVSTYNTDYILTKAAQFPQALDALEAAGHTVVR